MMSRLYLRLVTCVFIFIISSSHFAQDSDTAGRDTAANSEAPAAFDVYIVQSGDTLFEIAQQFNTDVAALRSANNLAEGDQIQAGQSLLVPTGQNVYVEIYEVRPGDTLFGISKRYNTTVDNLKSMNEIADERHIVAGQRLLVPAVNECGPGSLYRGRQ